MSDRFTKNNLIEPLRQLNKQIHDAGHRAVFELYGESVGQRRLFSLLEVSNGSLTLIPRSTARDMFYTLNALCSTLEHVGLPFRPDWADWRMRDLDRDIRQHGTA
jgi:hypothetical protein